MVFNLIAVLIIIYSCQNYKKAFFIYLIYKLVLVQNISLVSVPGLPVLTLDMCMSFWFLLLYLFRGSKKYDSHTTFPYTVPFALWIVSWLLSSIYSVAGFSTEITAVVRDVTSNIILIYLLWKLVDSEEDFRFLFKWITIAIFCTCLYGFIEFILQYNPLQNYEEHLMNDPTRTIDFSYTTFERGYRISSVFEHAIGAGLTWSLYIIAVIASKIKRGIKLPLEKFSYLTSLLCLICVFLTKMRSPLIFLGLGLLSCVNFKKKRFWIFLFITLGLGTLCLYAFRNNLTVLWSLFDSNAATEVKGSNLEQRQGQFEVAFQVIRNSPWFGVGQKYDNVLPPSLTSGLLGLESIWLQALVWNGYFGVITYAVWFYYIIFKVPLKYHDYTAMFVAIAYGITDTFSSLPGFNIYLLYLVIFYFIKSTRKYNWSK